MADLNDEVVPLLNPHDDRGRVAAVGADGACLVVWASGVTVWSPDASLLVVGHSSGTLNAGPKARELRVGNVTIPHLVTDLPDGTVFFHDPDYPWTCSAKDAAWVSGIEVSFESGEIAYQWIQGMIEPVLLGYEAVRYAKSASVDVDPHADTERAPGARA